MGGWSAEVALSDPVWTALAISMERAGDPMKDSMQQLVRMGSKLRTEAQQLPRAHIQLQGATTSQAPPASAATPPADSQPSPAQLPAAPLSLQHLLAQPDLQQASAPSGAGQVQPGSSPAGTGSQQGMPPILPVPAQQASLPAVQHLQQQMRRQQISELRQSATLPLPSTEASPMSSPSQPLSPHFAPQLQASAPAATGSVAEAMALPSLDAQQRLFLQQMAAVQEQHRQQMQQQHQQHLQEQQQRDQQMQQQLTLQQELLHGYSQESMHMRKSLECAQVHSTLQSLNLLRVQAQLDSVLKLQVRLAVAELVQGELLLLYYRDFIAA